jgi:hypothetical protein
MSHTPTARMRSGQRYAGNRKFMGNGLSRSCGKCGKHFPGDGGGKHRILGWVCRTCKDPK